MGELKIDAFHFMEKLLQSVLHLQNINHESVAEYAKDVAFFNWSAIVHSIFSVCQDIAKIHGNHLERVVSFLNQSIHCERYIDILVKYLLREKDFSFDTFRTFLALICELASLAQRARMVFLSDDLIFTSATYIRDIFHDHLRKVGGWKAFQLDCILVTLKLREFKPTWHLEELGLPYDKMTSDKQSIEASAEPFNFSPGAVVENCYQPSMDVFFGQCNASLHHMSGGSIILSENINLEKTKVNMKLAYSWLSMSGGGLVPYGNVPMEIDDVISNTMANISGGRMISSESAHSFETGHIINNTLSNVFGGNFVNSESIPLMETGNVINTALSTMSGGNFDPTENKSLIETGDIISTALSMAHGGLSEFENMHAAETDNLIDSTFPSFAIPYDNLSDFRQGRLHEAGYMVNSSHLLPPMHCERTIKSENIFLEQPSDMFNDFSSSHSRSVGNYVPLERAPFKVGEDSINPSLSLFNVFNDNSAVFENMTLEKTGCMLNNDYALPVPWSDEIQSRRVSFERVEDVVNNAFSAREISDSRFVHLPNFSMPETGMFFNDGCPLPSGINLSNSSGSYTDFVPSIPTHFQGPGWMINNSCFPSAMPAESHNSFSGFIPLESVPLQETGSMINNSCFLSAAPAVSRSGYFFSENMPSQKTGPAINNIYSSPAVTAIPSNAFVPHENLFFQETGIADSGVFPSSGASYSNLGLPERGTYFQDSEGMINCAYPSSFNPLVLQENVFLQENEDVTCEEGSRISSATLYSGLFPPEDVAFQEIGCAINDSPLSFPLDGNQNVPFGEDAEINYKIDSSSDFTFDRLDYPEDLQTESTDDILASSIIILSRKVIEELPNT